MGIEKPPIPHARRVLRHRDPRLAKARGVARVGSLRTEANTVYGSNADVLESVTSSTVDELAEKRLLSSVR